MGMGSGGDNMPPGVGKQWVAVVVSSLFKIGIFLVFNDFKRCYDF
jgi:hypothetical protein